MKNLIIKSVLILLCAFCAQISNAQWLTPGNTLTAPGTLGSLNAYPVLFKTNGVEKMRLPVFSTTSRSTLIIGGTKGVFDSPFPNYQYMNLSLDIQNPTATTYGANRGVNAKTKANGSTATGNAEGSIATSATWSANSGMYGVGGLADSVSKVIAVSKASGAFGGTFGINLQNATLTSNGSNAVKIAGVIGTLNGTVASYPTTGYLSAVVGEDLINHGGTNPTYAGYFVGKTYCTSGAWFASDRRFKTGITTISSALDRVGQLRGVQYEYDHTKFADRSFSEGKTDGFIAQELREVLPELVMEGPDGFLAVNYQGVIPVLTEAVKELKSEKDMQISELENRISEKDRQISALEARLAKLENLMASSATDRVQAQPAQPANFLLGNQPNPFAGMTTINFNLPETVKNAELVVRDMEGKQVVRQAVSVRGQSSTSVNLQNAPNGTYICTLMADGQNAGTLKLVVSGK